MKQVVSFVFTIFILLTVVCFPVVASDSDIKINEFSSSGSSDWVEIYNTGTNTIDLVNYRLRDSTSTNKLDLNGLIDPGGYIVFEWSNKLNNSGDTLRLVLQSSEDTDLDMIEYGAGKTVTAPNGNETGGRQPDGDGEWKVLAEATKGASNGSASSVPTLEPSPTITSTPTKTPTSTTAPTPSKTPTPTKIPTPTKTPTPAKSSTSLKTPTPRVLAAKTSSKPTPTLSHAPAPTSVLGESTTSPKNRSKPTISPTSLPVKILGFSGINPAIIFIAAGLLTLGGCGVLLYFNYRKELS